MKLTFFGGAGILTGSNYLLEQNNSQDDEKFLVDCGLFQGSDYCERKNFEPFSYSPKSIKAVFITHAHLDHIGRLPKLYRDGFRGKVFSTPPTKEFSRELLIDSADILEREAKAKGLPKLYSIEDIDKLMNLWEEIDYHEKFNIGDLEVEFFDAGHILGSAFIAIKDHDKKIVFSGDLGNTPAPLINPTDSTVSLAADYAILESTYGGSIHQGKNKQKDILEDLIEDTVKNNGTLLIPAFAMERTQELLFELNELVENRRIPRVPIFLDSPLAIKLTNLYQKYSYNQKYINQESLKIIRGGDEIFDFPGLRFCFEHKESEEIDKIKGSKIIIAGSGMMQGGRIMRHAYHFLPDKNSAILFVGYQVKNSLGRQILDGAKKVKIFGEEIPVNARVEFISSYSAHADQNMLLNWLIPMRSNLKKVFIVHGEEEQIMSLNRRIKDELAIATSVPSIGEEIVI